MQTAAIIDAVRRSLHTDVLNFLQSCPNNEEVPRFAANLLLEKCLSKCRDIVNDDADEKALALFLECNSRCAQMSDWINPSPVFEYLLGEIRDILYRFFEVPQDPYFIINDESVYTHMNTGPGAARGAAGYSFLEKMGFSTPQFSKASLMDHYSLRLHLFHDLWSDAQKRAIQTFGPFTLCSGSKLQFVPKKREISRTIGTPPLGDSFYQHSIRSILEERCRNFFGIDLSVQQDINRFLAKIGSRSDNLATIDLTSCSDLMAIWPMSQLLPKQAFRWFMLTRTDSMELPDGEVIPLHMLATMGNAWCFPLQTILFCAVVQAVYKLMGIPFLKAIPVSVQKPHISYETNQLQRKILNKDYLSLLEKAGCNFGVNGDDIIVVSEAYNEVCRTLCTIGFLVNSEKSFAVGKFRESCGGDYLDGHLVRPVYIKTLATLQAKFVAINLLTRWSARHNVPLTHTISTLMRSCERMVFVPPFESFDAGVHLCWRYRSGSPTKYQAYRPLVDSMSVGLSERGTAFFPEAVLLSALRGNLHDNELVFRNYVPLYRKVGLSCPGWDYLGIPPHLYDGVDLATLEKWQGINYYGLGLNKLTR